MRIQSITKMLTANDTGETGGHQAGLLIPRKDGILSFFPRLDSRIYNPRAHLQFEDSSGKIWDFAFIFYNNSKFGGTRNEYRLTRMTKYIRESGLTTGDEVKLHRTFADVYSISYRRTNEQENKRDETGRSVLTLGSGWHIIEI